MFSSNAAYTWDFAKTIHLGREKEKPIKGKKRKMPPIAHPCGQRKLFSVKAGPGPTSEGAPVSNSDNVGVVSSTKFLPKRKMGQTHLYFQSDVQ